ncbi:hypothetical protein JHK87_017585 [Glycine soja]|nr:hypothetical protein JHK87_017585 [Glycine soja]
MRGIWAFGTGIWKRRICRYFIVAFVEECVPIILLGSMNYLCNYDVGRDYNPKKRPVIPVMLWKPHEPVYPRLIKTTINGLSIKETKEIWKRGLPMVRDVCHDMVPCILVTFENEQIVVWRGKDYEPRKDGYFLKDRESFDDIGGLCVGKEQQAM